MLQIHNEKLEKYEREMALSDENTKQTYMVNYSNAIILVVLFFKCIL
jgi:hypothetical protein